MDERISKLAREYNGCPDDPLLRERYFTALTSTFGKTTLPILDDYKSWKDATQIEQDSVIALVAHQLYPRFSWVCTRTWPRYEDSEIYYRTATFKHVQTGHMLNLLPGNPGMTVKPMLFSQFLFTEGEVWMLAAARKKWNRIPRYETQLLPRTNISVESILEFCGLLDADFRLPYGPERLHAMRAGTTTTFYWGNRFDRKYVWCSSNSGRLRPAEDHVLVANPFGLIDMIGNASEFVANPGQGNAPDRYHYLSGSYANTYRSRAVSIIRKGKNKYTGFRLVLTLDI